MGLLTPAAPATTTCVFKVEAVPRLPQDADLAGDKTGRAVLPRGPHTPSLISGSLVHRQGEETRICEFRTPTPSQGNTSTITTSANSILASSLFEVNGRTAVCFSLLDGATSKGHTVHSETELTVPVVSGRVRDYHS